MCSSTVSLELPSEKVRRRFDRDGFDAEVQSADFDECITIPVARVIGSDASLRLGWIGSYTATAATDAAAKAHSSFQGTRA